MCCSRAACAQWGVLLPVALVHLGVGLGLSWGCFPGSPVLGAALAGALLNFVGRKPVLALTAILLAAATLCRVFQVPEMASRVWAGAAMGLSVASSFFYLAETSPSRARGAVCCTPQLTTLAGRTVAYALGPYLDEGHLAVLSPPPAILGLLILTCAPESPFFLAHGGRGGDLLHSLARLRGQRDEHAMRGEAEEVLDSVREQASGCGGRGVALAIVLSGTLPLLGSHLEETRAPTLDPQREPLFLVSCGLTQLAGVAACALLVDFAGRRPLALLGCILVLLAHSGTGALLFLAEPVALASWIPLATSVTFAVGLALVSTVSWIVLAEVVPMRGKCYVPLVVFLLDGVLQAAILSVDAVFGEVWRYVFYWVCAGWAAVIAVVIATMPETKKHTLCQLHEIFRGPNRGNAQTRL